MVDRAQVIGLVGTAGVAVLATQVKTWAEGLLQPAAEKILPPAPVEKVQLGADPAGHPESMPPAELADRVTGDRLSDEQRTQAASRLHWVMGIGAAAAYALARSRDARVGVGAGAGFGLALFAATHGSTLPALGVQHPVAQQPHAWWVWEGGSHVLYGVAVEAGLRVVDRLSAAAR